MKIYSIEEQTNGFTVTDERGMIIEVVLWPEHNPTQFRVTHNIPLSEFTGEDDEYPNSTYRLGFADGAALVTSIAALIGRQWVPPISFRRYSPLHEVITKPEPLNTPFEQSILAVHSRLIQQVSPSVLAVQRATNAFGVGGDFLSFEPALYQHDEIIQHIVQNRAAAAAVILIPYALPENLWRSILSHHLELSEHGVTAYLDQLKEWRAFFTPDGKIYQELLTTLEVIPADMPANLLFALRYARLPRAVTDRVELTHILASFESQHDCGFEFLAHESLLLNANRSAIELSLRRFGLEIGEDLSVENLEDVRRFSRFVCEFAPLVKRADGALETLTEEALYEQSHNWTDEEILETLDDFRELLSPPRIELPSDPSIRFLSSISSLREEALQVGEPLYDYLIEAANSKVYVFHISRNKEEATVVVSQSGQILLSLGTGTGAVDWGIGYLTSWGTQLKDFS